MSAIETVAVRLPVFRSPGGRATCLQWASEDRECQFLAFRDFGTRQICTWDRVPIAVQYDPPESYIRPHPACPLWSHADRGDGFTHSGDNGIDCGCRK